MNMSTLEQLAEITDYDREEQRALGRRRVRTVRNRQADKAQLRRAWSANNFDALLDIQ